MSDSNKDDKALNDFYMKHRSFYQVMEEKEYKRFDQMSLAELEALVERLQAIIANIKQAGAQGGEKS